MNRANVYSKRKRVDGELPEPVTCKKPCNSPPPASPPRDYVFLQELAEQQEEVLRSRLLQEEEDRRLALRLQRELNRESAVDRRKGSADGYLLREKSSLSSHSSTSRVEENKTGKAGIPHSSIQKVDGHKSGKRASSQVEWKVLRNSSVSTQVSPSLASSVRDSRKQTTLTQMFPRLESWASCLNIIINSLIALCFHILIFSISPSIFSLSSSVPDFGRTGWGWR